MPGFLNPLDSEHSSASRPTHQPSGAGERRWYVNGTVLYGQDVNTLAAQFRDAADFYSIPDVEGDDTVLRQLLAAATVGKNLEALQTTLASTATTNLGAAPTLAVVITGTTTISSFGVTANQWRIVRVTGALVLANGANLITPTGRNIDTQPGDTFIAVSDAAGVWRVHAYQRIDGQPLTRSIPINIASATVLEINAGWPDIVNITGTTPITSFGTTAPMGTIKTLRFVAATGCDIVYNATTMLTPGNVTYRTFDDDYVTVHHVGTLGNWVVENIWNRRYGVPNTTREVTVASAATVDLASTIARSFTITGTTNITSLGAGQIVGTIKHLHFSGALTLTNSAALLLPGGVDFTTAAADQMMFRYDGGANLAWRCIHFRRNATDGNTLIETFLATGTWTKKAGAKMVTVIGVGAGGSGASGRRGAASTICSGGGAGGGGAVHIGQWPATLLGATEAVTIDAGVPGGAARATDDTNGANGNGGIATAFGTWLVAGGGGAGAAGVATTSSGGGGGGLTATGTPGTTTGAGGEPIGIADKQGGQGGVAGANGASASWGGGGGGGGTSAAVAGSGGDAFDGGGGGGGGGSLTAANAIVAAGPGGATRPLTMGVGEGGAAGVAAVGTAGSSNATKQKGYAGDGGGGGAATLTGAAYAGGAGGFPGGGGGGGGASRNGNNSGAGGAGGAGVLYVITHF